jgi:hypothetical protein
LPCTGSLPRRGRLTRTPSNPALPVRCCWNSRCNHVPNVVVAWGHHNSSPAALRSVEFSSWGSQLCNSAAIQQRRRQDGPHESAGRLGVTAATSLHRRTGCSHRTGLALDSLPAFAPVHVLDRARTARGYPDATISAMLTLNQSMAGGHGLRGHRIGGTQDSISSAWLGHRRTKKLWERVGTACSSPDGPGRRHCSAGNIGRVTATRRFCATSARR